MKRLRRHATYANIVASLALCVAVGTGGAYAATQLSKNSVGSRALKNRSVKIEDLGKGVRQRLVDVERANVANDGTLTSGTAVRATSGAPTSPGSYTVTFDHRVARCTYSATPAAVPSANGDSFQIAAGARLTGQGGRQVKVTTYDTAGNPMPSGFHLTVIC